MIQLETLTGNLQKLLILHEGKSPKPYPDTVGKITIGVGRNLTDRGVSEDEIALMLSNDIDNTVHQFKSSFPDWWNNFDEVRKLVLLDMIYNLGINRFLDFTTTIAALNAGDFTGARIHMLDSRWAAQTGDRAIRLSNMMLTGELPEEIL